jgi:uncharacterized protein (TIGR02246 family)
MEAIREIVAGLEKAWNNADADGFGQWFTEAAQFVNVYGMYAQGRPAIVAGHKGIFEGVYKGSAVSFALLQFRLLREDVALVHVRAHLRVPEGPMAGEHDALPSMVLTREAGVWKIAGFHNTFVSQPRM